MSGTRRSGWRWFSSDLDRGERRVYGAVTMVFVVAFVAFMWPVYPLFDRIRPLVLGLPLSLVYLVGLLAVCFFSLLALYRWELRTGRLSSDGEEAAQAPGDVPSAAATGGGAGMPRRRPDDETTGRGGGGRR